MIPPVLDGVRSIMAMESRRRNRTSLLLFAGALLLTAIWFAVRASIHQQAVRAIRAAGGTVRLKAAVPDWMLEDWLPAFVVEPFLHRTCEVQFANVGATDADLAPLADLSEVTWLELHTTHVEGPGLVSLKKHTRVRRLFLNSNPITDEGLAQLRDLREIDWLELSGTRITDDGLPHLAGMQKLNRLALSETGITDTGLRHLVPLKGLQKLGLYKTGLTDAAVEVLSQMHGLKELDLTGTRISDTGVAELRKALPDCRIIHRLTPGATSTSQLIEASEALERMGGRLP